MIKPSFKSVLVSYPGKTFAEYIEKRWPELDVHFCKPRSFEEQTEIIKKNKIDIMLMREWYPPDGYIEKAQKKGCFVIHWRSHPHIEGMTDRRLRLMAKCDMRIVEGKYCADWMQGQIPKSKVHYIPRAVNEDIYFPLAKERTIQVSFIGGKMRSREMIFEEIERNGLHVHRFGKQYPNGKVTGEKFRETVARTMINLCPLKPGTGTDISDRELRVMASGGFCLHEFAGEIPARFEIGVDLDTFYSPKDAVEKVWYYLDNPEEREQIAMRGMNLVRQKYTYTTFLNEVFRLIECQGG